MSDQESVRAIEAFAGCGPVSEFKSIHVPLKRGEKSAPWLAYDVAHVRSVRPPGSLMSVFAGGARLLGPLVPEDLLIPVSLCYLIPLSFTIEGDADEFLVSMDLALLERHIDFMCFDMLDENHGILFRGGIPRLFRKHTEEGIPEVVERSSSLDEALRALHVSNHLEVMTSIFDCLMEKARLRRWARSLIRCEIKKASENTNRLDEKTTIKSVSLGWLFEALKGGSGDKFIVLNPTMFKKSKRVKKRR